MPVELRLLGPEEVAAHNAGEDGQIVRWFSGGYGTAETTAAHFDLLTRNLERSQGKRGFGIWLDGVLAGYVDCDPSPADGLTAGDVNVSYSVHPWARGSGVAGRAVALICDFIREQRIGTRAAIRVEPGNDASVRVAEKAGFTHTRDFLASEPGPDGTSVRLRLYLRDLT